MKSNLTAVSNQIWLQYFNQYLYDKGIITEAEKNKMANLISITYSKEISSINVPTELTKIKKCR